MKLTYNNVTIEFFDSVPDQILLSLSGGLDSASLFYVLSKYLPQIKVIPFTCKDLSAPVDALLARDIVSWMQEVFPENNIADLEEYEFDHNDTYWVKLAEKEWERLKVPNNGRKVARAGKITGLAKIFQKESIESTLRKKYSNALICTGTTCNPPIDEQKKYGFYDIAERRRDPPPSHPKRITDRSYHPFNEVDKKFVAAIYKDHNLMDSLYQLTNSCIGSAKITENFTKECEECFWCHEKKWAFKC
jgi:hypothetical protein